MMVAVKERRRAQPIELPRVLVVDEEPAIAHQVVSVLSATVETVFRGSDAVTAVQKAVQAKRAFDVILLSYHLPDCCGGDVYKELCEQNIGARIIMVDGRDPAKVAVAALQMGAFDFIAKPFSATELILRVDRAFTDSRAARTVRTDRRRRKSDIVIGCGKWVKSLYDRIGMVAATDVGVALSGESGTGKDLVARTIHDNSQRRDRAFVRVDCAALPGPLLENELFGHARGAFTGATEDRCGLFAAAHGGTLFLDEIAEIPVALQAKLLHVLQSQEYRRIGETKVNHADVRLITATNQNLLERVKTGDFREDLYYRINVFPIELMALRSRKEDIPLLAQHFLFKHRGSVGRSVERFSHAAMAKLCGNPFPGNVRELENVVQRALVLSTGDSIGVEDIASNIVVQEHSSPPLDMSREFRDLKREVVENFEQRYTKEVLRINNGNTAASARQAGMDRKSMWSLVKKYNLDTDRFR